MENGQIVKTQVVDINGQGHGALAGVGIKLFGGVSSDADETVKAYAEGKLDYNPDVHCTLMSMERDIPAESITVGNISARINKSGI